MEPERSDRIPAPDTVACPDCGTRADVLARFVDAGVEYLQIRCPGSLTVLVRADQVRRPRYDNRLMSA